MDIWLFVFDVFGASVDVYSVKEGDVNNSGNERSETQGVSHSEDWADQERGVLLISRNIQSQVWVQNPRRVVNFTEVVEVGVGTHWQVSVEFCTSECQGPSADQNNESTNKGVPDRERRELKRVVEEASNTAPIKSPRDKS